MYGELTLRKEGFSGDGVEGVNAGQMSVRRVGDDLWIEGLPEDSECGLSIVDPSGRVLSTEYRREGRSAESLWRVWLPAPICFRLLPVKVGKRSVSSSRPERTS